MSAERSCAHIAPAGATWRARVRAIAPVVPALLFGFLLVLPGCGPQPDRLAQCTNRTAGPVQEYALPAGARVGDFRFHVVEAKSDCQHGSGTSADPSALSKRGTAPDPAQPIRFDAIDYEECAPTVQTECWHSLEIQSWPECRRNATSYAADGTDRQLVGEGPYTVAGDPALPALEFEAGTRIELYDGATTVVVFGGERQLTEAAVRALVAANPATLGKPPPTAWAATLDPALRCPRTLSGRRREVPSRSMPALDTTFTHSQRCTRGSVDPINVLWMGSSVEAVSSQLYARPGWHFDDDRELGPDHQWAAASGSTCAREQDMRASSCFFCDRDHIRLFAASWQGRPLVLGDAHHDQGVYLTSGCEKWGFVPAAHISSTFDGAREAIFEQWHAHAQFAYWGNTRGMRQCNGLVPHSDGDVLEIQAAKVPTPRPVEAHIPRTCSAPSCRTRAAPHRPRRELEATLAILHASALARRQRTVCEQIVPVAAAGRPRYAAAALARYVEACAGRLTASELATLARGTADTRLGRAVVRGDLASAPLAGVTRGKSAEARFVYLGSRWRLLVGND